jgi:hypothetical protein
MGEIQKQIDAYMRQEKLRTVSDIVYSPYYEIVTIFRNTVGREGKRYGRRPITLDVSSACSPAEVIDIISNCTAVNPCRS